MTFNLTFMNKVSLHSRLFVKNEIEISQLENNNDDLVLVKECIKVNSVFPNIMQPYFGNI